MPLGRGLKLVGQVLALALVAGLLALLAWRVAHGGDDTVSAALRKGDHPAAPNFELERLDGGGTIDLASLRGKPVVLDFWASWCYPCQRQSQRLEAAMKRYGGRVHFVGVDTKDYSGDARRWLRRHGITYPSVHDGAGKVLQRWGGLPIPRIFFIDREGKVAGELVVEEDLPRYLRRLTRSS